MSVESESAALGADWSARESTQMTGNKMARDNEVSAQVAQLKKEIKILCRQNDEIREENRGMPLVQAQLDRLREDVTRQQLHIDKKMTHINDINRQLARYKELFGELGPVCAVEAAAAEAGEAAEKEAGSASEAVGTEGEDADAGEGQAVADEIAEEAAAEDSGNYFRGKATPETGKTRSWFSESAKEAAGQTETSEPRCLDVDVKAPSLDVKAPSLDVKAPSLDVKAPSLDVKAPSLDVKAPSLDVDVKAPSLDVDV
eukprot:TRINITY_DN15722_c0_g1_i5.p1 TRINITY_DN15722_c0_g1~~TRINITY_DN15722_c0_g1_i5.p1  ORF type:complete len:258 (+),score=92.50 TRINITY_DN15722_c0_g1_i5:133-906(+)